MTILLGLLVTSAAWLPRQDTVRIREQPSCAECSIEFVHIAALGHRNDESSPNQFASYAVDSRSRIYVAPMVDQSTVGVYGSDGKLIRLIGRRGQGPGEYVAAHEVKALPGDSLLVSDPALGRFTILNPDYTVARTIPVAHSPMGVVPEGARGFVVHAIVPTPQRAGLPLHQVSQRGTFDLSFGSLGEPFILNRISENVRVIARAGANAVWSAPVNRYRIELWQSNGSLRRVLLGSPPWFQPWTEQSSDILAVRPETRIRGLFQDDSGLLWVISHVPALHWQPLRAQTRTEAGMPSRAMYHKLLDTMIEVMDPTTGELLVRSRYDELFNAYLSGGSGLVDTQTEMADGHVVLHLWRPQLVRTPRR